MDTLARDLLGTLHLGSDVGIWALLNQARKQRVADGLRKRGKLCVKPACTETRALLYPLKVAIIKRDAF